MFTGIIQKTGRLDAVRRVGTAAEVVLRVEAPWESPLELGESVAVQGVCLTLCEVGDVVFACDVLEETLSLTTLGVLQPGMRVNVERALRVGDRVGGHFVTGHVDGVGRVEQIRTVGRDHVLRVSCDGPVLAGIVLKGSVAIAGVSLTVTAVDAAAFEVHLIPFSSEHTTLGDLKVGDGVNLETDMLGKHVRQQTEGQASEGITWQTLEDAGFC